MTAGLTMASMEPGKAKKKGSADVSLSIIKSDVIR